MAPQIALLPYKEASHRSFLHTLLSDKNLMTGWGMEPLKSEEIDAWVKELSRVSLMIQDVLTKDIVGYVNFYDWNKEKMEADWGIVIAPQFHGKGYAQEAGKASILYGFNILNLLRIEIYIEEFNKVSQYIHEKLGYKFSHTDEKARRIYHIERNA